MAPQASERLRQLNGKYGALKRHHPEADTTDLRRELAAERIAAYVRQTVGAAPPLTAQQRDRLALLLRSADAGDRAA